MAVVSSREGRFTLDSDWKEGGADILFLLIFFSGSDKKSIAMAFWILKRKHIHRISGGKQWLALLFYPAATGQYPGKHGLLYPGWALV